MVSIICRGLMSNKFMFIVIFIEIKNRLSNKFLKGLIVIFSLWWNLFFVRIILVKKVFSVIERLIFCISNVMLIIKSKVVIVNSLCMLFNVMYWNSGLSRKCLFSNKVVIFFVIYRVFS